jgi:hypothetical protein
METNLLKNALIVLGLLSAVFCCSELQGDDNEIPYVGFKVIQAVDQSRIYKRESDTTDYLHYRPLDIDLWYPAKANQSDSMLVFRDILGLLEKRANYYTASNAAHGLTKQLAQYFCDFYKCPDTTALLNYKTRSFFDAQAIDKKFPLVVYLASYNGMGYENFSLFEDLVRKGFVVVSINSIGRYPGDMTMKNEDMMEQVNDAVASIKQLEAYRNIDFSKIGIIGYSWGGLSAAVLADKIEGTKCLISFDGSEFHQYGQAKDEDADFEEIRNSMDFQELKLPIPYLRLESSTTEEANKHDSVYNFSEKLSNDQLILQVDSAGHGDFSCLPVIVRKSGNCGTNRVFKTITDLTIGFLEQHLKNSNSFSVVLKKEVNKTVTVR